MAEPGYGSTHLGPRSESGTTKRCDNDPPSWRLLEFCSGAVAVGFGEGWRAVGAEDWVAGEGDDDAGHLVEDFAYWPEWSPPGEAQACGLAGLRRGRWRTGGAGNPAAESTGR